MTDDWEQERELRKVGQGLAGLAEVAEEENRATEMVKNRSIGEGKSRMGLGNR